MRFLRVIVIIVLAMVAQPILEKAAEARRGGGFSRSFSRGGRGLFSGATRGKSNWGSSRSSGYSRKGGLFGSRAKSSRGRGFGKSGKAGGRRSSMRTRNSRGQRYMGRSHGSATSRTGRATTYRQRYRRPTMMFNSHYYGGVGWGGFGWGMRSVGVWDLFFLSTMSHMFWHHHWHDPGIQRALYKENLLQDEELKKLEKRVKELEGEGVKRDPNYLPEDVDPDLAYSKEYVEKNPDQFYKDVEEEKLQESGIGLSSLLTMVLVAFFFYSFFVRRY